MYRNKEEKGNAARERAKRAAERGVHFKPPAPKIKGEQKGESEGPRPR